MEKVLKKKKNKNNFALKELPLFTEWLSLVGWLVGFYGISTFVGYLRPNPFLCK